MSNNNKQQQPKKKVDKIPLCSFFFVCLQLLMSGRMNAEWCLGGWESVLWKNKKYNNTHSMRMFQQQHKNYHKIIYTAPSYIIYYIFFLYLSLFT